MKNFKIIISLVALVAMSNAWTVVTVVQKKIAAAVDKIAKNPNTELTADEKTLLNKHLNDNDANINRLKNIKDFDMSQLTQITAATVEQHAPQTAAVQKKVAPVKKAAPTKPLTAAQKRAAARKEATTVKPVAVHNETVTQSTQTPTKTLVSTPLEQNYAYTKVANSFYDIKTNTLKINGVRAYITSVREIYPDISDMQLITKTYEHAVAVLKAVINPMVPAAIKMFDALCNKLMTMIEDIVNKPLLSPEERSFALLYDAKTKTLKPDGVREFVAITRTANPTMSNAELIQKTYDNAVEILKTTLNPMVPAAIKLFDALCNKLMTMIKNTVNKPLPALPQNEKPIIEKLKIAPLSPKKSMPEQPSPMPKKPSEEPIVTNKIQVQPTELTPEKPIIEPKNLAEYKIVTLRNPSAFYKVSSLATQNGLQQKWFNEAVRIATENPASSNGINFDIFNMVFKLATEVRNELSQQGKIPKDINDEDITTMTMDGITFWQPAELKEEQQPVVEKKKALKQEMDELLLMLKPKTKPTKTSTSSQPTTLAQYKRATLRNPSTFYKTSPFAGLQQRWFNEAVRIAKEDPANSKAIGFDIFNMIFKLATELRDELSKKGKMPKDINDEDITTMTMAGIEF
jgi:hypothetical protein